MAVPPPLTNVNKQKKSRLIHLTPVPYERASGGLNGSASCGRGGSNGGELVRLSIVVIAAVAFVVAGKEEEATSDPFLLPAHHAERMRQGGGGGGGGGGSGGCGSRSCWGYEPDCPFDRAFNAGEGISCDPERDPYTGRDSRRVFFDQADFGYLAKIGSSMWELCHGDGGEGGDGGVGGSTFSCSENLLFCHRRNVMVNLREVQRERRSLRYQMDVLRKGQIGGSCHSLDLEMLEFHLEHMAPLQSWAPKLRNFANLSSSVAPRGLAPLRCLGGGAYLSDEAGCHRQLLPPLLRLPQPVPVSPPGLLAGPAR